MNIQVKTREPDTRKYRLQYGETNLGLTKLGLYGFDDYEDSFLLLTEDCLLGIQGETIFDATKMVYENYWFKCNLSYLGEVKTLSLEL